MNEVQGIYINLDDSGKLTSKEKISVYGGLVFYQKMKKINLLRNIEVSLTASNVTIVIIRIIVIKSVQK